MPIEMPPLAYFIIGLSSTIPMKFCYFRPMLLFVFEEMCQDLVYYFLCFFLENPNTEICVHPLKSQPLFSSLICIYLSFILCLKCPFKLKMGKHAFLFFILLDGFLRHCQKFFRTCING